MPIRPQSPDEVWLEVQQDIDQSLIDIGAVVPINTAMSLPQESMKAIKL
jgi:hypothetical protein